MIGMYVKRNMTDRRKKQWKFAGSFLRIFFGIIFILISFAMLADSSFAAFFVLLLIGLALFVWQFFARKKRHSSVSDESSSSSDTKAKSTFSASHANFTEVHEVVGEYYYTDGIKAAGIPNPLFQLSKKELLQAKTGYKVYEFKRDGYSAQLIEEPDNEYDPNAVKVVIAGQKVGHIAREECLEIKKLIHKHRIVSVTATLKGGRYKLINRDSGSVTTVNGDYAITLTLNLR